MAKEIRIGQKYRRTSTNSCFVVVGPHPKIKDKFIVYHDSGTINVWGTTYILECEEVSERWKALLWLDPKLKVDVQISSQWFESEKEVTDKWTVNPYFIKAVRID